MAAPTQLDVQRHVGEMSAKDQDVVVQTLAEIIVTYLKQNSGTTQHAGCRHTNPDVNRRAAKTPRQKENRA